MSVPATSAVAAPVGVRYEVADFLREGYVRRTLEAVPRSSRAAVPWWERVDPYWSDMLFVGSQQWTCDPPRVFDPSDACLYQPSLSAVLGDRPDMAQQAVVDAPPEQRDLWLRALGLVTLAGAISEPQVSALLGEGVYLQELGRLGAVEAAWHHPPGMVHPRVLVWRRRSGAAFDALVALSYADGTLHRYFGGVHPLMVSHTPHHQMRHQMLANEVAIRALEASPMWCGWLPEHMCTANRFVPLDHPARHTEQALEIQPDGCLVRVDGARVFLEVQATASLSKAREKVAQWERLLRDSPVGGVIVLLAAARPSNLRQCVLCLKQAVAEVASPATWGRMVVAQWDLWSPESGSVTAEGWRLAGVRLVGAGDRACWEPFDAASCESELPLEATLALPERMRGCGFLPDWVS